MTSDSDDLERALQENLRLRQELAANVDKAKDNSKSQKRSRLNGWQRIGIILSVLWIPVGWVLAVKSVPGPSSLDYPLSQICQDAQARMPNPDYAQCARDADKWMQETHPKLRESYRADVRRLAPWLVLAPIPIAWLLVYIVVWIARWVRRGFQTAS